MRLLLSLYLVFIGYRGQSQTPVSFIESDSILLNMQNRDHCQCLDLNRDVFQHDKIDTIAFFNWLKGFDFSTQDFNLPESNWKINMNTFYANGQSMSYFGDGWFSDLGLENKAQFLGLPIRLAGNLIIQNNQVNTRLSTLALNFDHQKYADQIMQKYKDRFYASAVESLTLQQQRLLQEQFQIESGLTILNHIDYKNCKTKAVKTLDSLQSATGDSIAIDSALARVQLYNALELRIDSMSRKYRRLQKEVREAHDQVRHSWNKQYQLLESKIQTGSLDQVDSDVPGMSKLKSIFAHISRLNLGSFSVTGSTFDISSIPVHGIGLEIRRNGYYATISYGREGKQRRNLPDYVRNLRLAGEGRRLAYVKAGIGMPEKSHVHLSLSQIQVSGTSSDTLFPSLPKRSVSLSLDSKYLLHDQFYLNLTGSLSGADFTGKTKTTDLLADMYDNMLGRGQNLACLAQVGWKDKSGINDINIGYQIIGSEFTTLGNLFLLKNRNTIRVEARHQIWKNRLQIKWTYLKGITKGENDLYPGIRQNQFSGTLSCRLDKRGSRIWGTFSPSNFLQVAPGASNAIYILNLITVGSQIQYPSSRKGQWSSTIQLTNFSDQTQYGDTSTISGLWYGMLMQSWVSDKYTFTVLSNIGLDQENWTAFRDINVDLSQSLSFKNIQVSQGAQLVKRPFENGFFAGISVGLQINTKQKIHLGTQITYLVALSAHMKNQVYLNTTLGWQF